MYLYYKEVVSFFACWCFGVRSHVCCLFNLRFALSPTIVCSRRPSRTRSSRSVCPSTGRRSRTRRSRRSGRGPRSCCSASNSSTTGSRTASRRASGSRGSTSRRPAFWPCGRPNPSPPLPSPEIQQHAEISFFVPVDRRLSLFCLRRFLRLRRSSSLLRSFSLLCPRTISHNATTQSRPTYTSEIPDSFRGSCPP